jgi:hypothetical protein
LNETKLKDLFASSLESGRILNNNGDSMSFVNPGDEIRIKNEAYFVQFDLVIAVLSRTKKQFEFGGENNYYNKVLMRTGQLTEFAKKRKVQFSFYIVLPVELKSNSDTLIAGEIVETLESALEQFGQIQESLKVK